ncbi:hypothetical protein ABEB36_013056, partial [Hypothenemus hampei]
MELANKFEIINPQYSSARDVKRTRKVAISPRTRCIYTENLAARKNGVIGNLVNSVKASFLKYLWEASEFIAVKRNGNILEWLVPKTVNVPVLFMLMQERQTRTYSY